MKSRGAPRPPPFDTPRSPSFFKAVYESVNVFGSTLWVTGTVAEPGTLYMRFFWSFALLTASKYLSSIYQQFQYSIYPRHNTTALTWPRTDACGKPTPRGRILTQTALRAASCRSQIWVLTKSDGTPVILSSCRRK